MMHSHMNVKKTVCNIHCYTYKFCNDVFNLMHLNIQCVPLATEPDISLIILTPMKILQRNLNRGSFVV
jgi:hypothetical protein